MSHLTRTRMFPHLPPQIRSSFFQIKRRVVHHQRNGLKTRFYKGNSR